MCAAYRCSRRYQERVFTTHDQSVSCVPLNHGATTVTSSISTKRWNEARSINDVRGSMVTEGRELRLYRDLSSSLSCCRRRAMRHSNGAKDAPRSSPIGCKVARHMHPSSQASISRRDGEGAMGRFARPRAPQKRHGQPSMCVGASPRGRVSPLIQLLHDRVVCDPKETRLARHKHRAAGASRSEEQESEREG